MDDTTARAPARPDLSHAEIRSIIVGILLALLLGSLDQTIVATAMPTIGRELGGFDQIAWIVTAYLLASTAVTPLYGKLSDAHGRRVVFLGAIAIFVLGSLACALAPTLPLLAAARFLQGLGGGGLISLAQIVIADIVAPRERGRYQVYIASTFVASSLAGPVLGGFIAEHLHWSVIFWINLPLGGLALVVADRALRRLPQRHRPQRLDWLGAALMALATSALLLALSWGGTRLPWASPPILGLLAGALILGALFALRLRTARAPLIPLTVLSNPVVGPATLAASCCMGTYIGLTIVVPLYFEAVHALVASRTGLAVIPLMIGTVVGATLSGRAMARLRHYKRVPLVGLSVAVAGTALLAAFPTRLPFLAVEALLAALSCGAGTLLPVSTVSIQNAVGHDEVGSATATANFCRSLGGALVVAIFGAILAGSTGGAAALSIEAMHGGGAGPSGPEIAALGLAFRWVFLAAAFGFALALAFAIRMPERPLRGRTEPVAPVAD